MNQEQKKDFQNQLEMIIVVVVMEKGLELEKIVVVK
jgi:hypothetical protein